jgi:apolipoprotein N-acyltransferase
VDALAVNARGAIDAHVPVSGRSLLSPQQRRINGLLIMLLFALIAFTLNVRQRLRVN